MKQFGWSLDYVLYKLSFLQAFHLFSVSAEMESGEIDDSISDAEAERIKQELNDQFVYDDNEKRYVLRKNG